jgi:hypothetical protein
MVALPSESCESPLLMPLALRVYQAMPDMSALCRLRAWAEDGACVGAVCRTHAGIAARASRAGRAPARGRCVAVAAALRTALGAGLGQPSMTNVVRHHELAVRACC